MDKAERSLRFMVEKWLVTAPVLSVRITRGSRARSNQRRYVYIGNRYRQARSESISSVKARVPEVCPPDAERLAMSVF